MIIHLDAKAGQTLEEFALELEYIANRLDCVIIAKYADTQFVATPGDTPSWLATTYKTNRRKP